MILRGSKLNILSNQVLESIKLSQIKNGKLLTQLKFSGESPPLELALLGIVA